MPLDIESAKGFIVAHLYEKGDFVPRQDLLIDSKSMEPEYSRKHLKVHSSVSEEAINQLVEEKVLAELTSSELLEEIIRTGMAEDDSFTDRPYIQQADVYDGDSILCFGSRLNFFILQNFATLVEFAEEHGFEAFRDFCYEVAASIDAFGPPADSFVSRRDKLQEIADITQILEEVERRLSQDNDLGKELASQKEVLVSEVRLLRDLVSQDQFRPSVLHAMAKRTLGWIADKAAGALVGGAAVAALAAIASIL